MVVAVDLNVWHTINKNMRKIYNILLHPPLPVSGLPVSGLGAAHWRVTRDFTPRPVSGLPTVDSHEIFF